MEMQERPGFPHAKIIFMQDMQMKIKKQIHLYNKKRDKHNAYNMESHALSLSFQMGYVSYITVITFDVPFR